ncbi:MAG: hypothetical protein IPJ61_18505 [Tessaracoccus sp.]|uniref:DUF7173 family protein n=1 Tax=Tessaracoccus sp. TaxID=1971211 RepID=UPI001EB5BAFF|nr:hypothetical protein [Tessaracoccus sp.]MBK7822977.1 hypothetical protein [Tessaracoccus sp.]
MSAVLHPVQSVDELVVDWIDAKRDEDAANKRRVAIEERIIALMGEPEEGSATHELIDGSKLTITSKITRTIDEAAWRAVMDRVPERLRTITFVETAKLDLKGIRYLLDHEPDVYGIVAQAITSKKAKSSISVRA